MTGKRLKVSEASYTLLCQRLRGVLVGAVQATPGAADGIGSVPCQAEVVPGLVEVEAAVPHLSPAVR